MDPLFLLAAAQRARQIKILIACAVAGVAVTVVAAVAGLTAVMAALPGGGGAAAQAAVMAWTGQECQAPATTQASFGQWDTTQVTNAATIITTGQSLGVAVYGQVIAVATAMQESALRNLAYGDRDSLGLFQQRPSQGWGTPAQVMNPVYAATAFYKALLQVPGWQQLPLTVVAQDVQHSGTPQAYAQWQAAAAALVAHLTPGGTQLAALAGTCPGNCPQPAAGRPGGPCPALLPAAGATTVPSWYVLPPGTSQPVAEAIAYALAQLGKPYRWGAAGPDAFDCSGLVMMAYKAAGITLQRTTFAQVTEGTAVPSLSALLPGDLIFTPGSDGSAQNPGHVGMYLGAGIVIAAPQQGTPVQLTNLAGYWAQQAVSIRRIVPAGSTS